MSAPEDTAGGTPARVIEMKPVLHANISGACGNCLVKWPCAFVLNAWNMESAAASVSEETREATTPLVDVGYYVPCVECGSTLGEHRAHCAAAPSAPAPAPEAIEDATAIANAALADFSDSIVAAKRSAPAPAGETTPPDAEPGFEMPYEEAVRYGISLAELTERINDVMQGRAISHEEAMRRIRDAMDVAAAPDSDAPTDADSARMMLAWGRIDSLIATYGDAGLAVDLDTVRDYYSAIYNSRAPVSVDLDALAARIEAGRVVWPDNTSATMPEYKRGYDNGVKWAAALVRAARTQEGNNA